MDLSSSFFWGMEAIPKKKGAKKEGSSFFYTDGPRSPFFFKAILQKIEGSPFFSFFFFVDCVFRVFAAWQRLTSIGPLGIFIARQADSPESLEFPICANHPIRANHATKERKMALLRGALGAKRPLRGAFCDQFCSQRGPLRGPRVASQRPSQKTPPRPQNLSEPPRTVAPIPVAPSSFSERG